MVYNVRVVPSLMLVMLLASILTVISSCRANGPPVIDSTSPKADAEIPGRTVEFRVEARDPDRDNLSFKWDFGDGTISEEQNPTHTYEKEGHYNVRVTVADKQYKVSKDFSITLITEPPPLPSLRGAALREGLKIAAELDVLSDEDLRKAAFRDPTAFEQYCETWADEENLIRDVIAKVRELPADATDQQKAEKRAEIQTLFFARFRDNEDLYLRMADLIGISRDDLRAKIGGVSEFASRLADVFMDKTLGPTDPGYDNPALSLAAQLEKGGIPVDPQSMTDLLKKPGKV
jgi:PKD repeat protein